jgi:hypothetical protein
MPDGLHEFEGQETGHTLVAMDGYPLAPRGRERGNGEEVFYSLRIIYIKRDLSAGVLIG